MPNTPKRGYGWRPSLPDFRDHVFALAKPIKLPETVDLRYSFPPIVDQLDLGSCTANAIPAIFDFALFKQHRPFLMGSRLFLYYNERAMEGTIASDAGAMIRDGIKSVVARGLCPESEWPYDVTKFAAEPTAQCYADALREQALAYQRIQANLTAMLQCLASGWPFVFGFSVYESFESPEVARSGIVPMPTLNEQMVGGHAVCAVGYDMARRMFLCRNSWGDLWGIGGHFWIPFDYLSNPGLADDRWKIALVE